jgi:hypothetical protein
MNAFQLARPRGTVLGPDPTRKGGKPGSVLNGRGKLQAPLNPDASRTPRDAPTSQQWRDDVEKRAAISRAKL